MSLSLTRLWTLWWWGSNQLKPGFQVRTLQWLLFALGWKSKPSNWALQTLKSLGLTMFPTNSAHQPISNPTSIPNPLLFFPRTFAENQIHLFRINFHLFPNTSYSEGPNTSMSIFCRDFVNLLSTSYMMSSWGQVPTSLGFLDPSEHRAYLAPGTWSDSVLSSCHLPGTAQALWHFILTADLETGLQNRRSKTCSRHQQVRDTI